LINYCIPHKGLAFCFNQVAKQNKDSVCFVGHTNAGKSSLVNALFGTSCAVSPVAETQGADKVYEDDKIRVFDVFGVNETEMYASTKLLMETKTVHVAVLVYADCIENTKRTTKMLKALGLAVVVVRNKVEIYVDKPADLEKIKTGDSAQATANGASAWTCTSATSKYGLDELRGLMDATLKKAAGLV
jgi:GTP-binding protein EngB required for normal cell division